MTLKTQILELKEKGLSNNKIAIELKVSSSTVAYHVNPEARRKQIERSIKNHKIKTPEERSKYSISRREYNKNYMKKRYAEDEVFREKQKERARLKSRERKA